MDGDYTLRETREEVRVETVETERVLCACCGQAYDEGEILTVGVDLDADGDAYAHRPLCRACASSALDYDAPQTTGEYIARAAWRRDLHDKLPGKDTLVSVGITATVAAIVVWVGMQVMAEMQTTLAENNGDVTFQQAAEQTTTAAPDVFGLVGAAFVVLIIAVVIMSMAHGPRRL